MTAWMCARTMFKAVQKSRQMAALQLSAHRCRAHYLSNVGNTELASDSGHVPTTGSVCKSLPEQRCTHGKAEAVNLQGRQQPNFGEAFLGCHTKKKKKQS